MEFNSENYRPLPKGTTVKKSSIDGLGVHATENIQSGVSLGKTHVMSNAREDGDSWIRTPLGGFLNHSITPNCFILSGTIIEVEGMYQIGEDCKTLYTVCPIKKGTELTVYYNLKEYKEDENI